MRTSFMCPLLLVLAVANTALAQDVRYNFDREADFSSFKTYRWVVLQGAAPLSELIDRQVKAAIDVELSKKGLSLSTEEGADLFIGYQAATDTETSLTSYRYWVGLRPRLVPRRLVRRRRRKRQDRDIHDLRRRAHVGFLFASSSDAGLARRREQDARSERQA